MEVPAGRLDTAGDSGDDIFATQGNGRIATDSAIAHLDFRESNDLRGEIKRLYVELISMAL